MPPLTPGQLKPTPELTAEWRALVPIVGESIYLYSGGFAPCARPVRAALEEAIEIWQNGGVALWERGEGVYHELRDRLGALMNVHGDDIVVVDSTTSAVNLAINLLAPDPAGNVVTTDLEFMTDTYAVLGRSPAPELRVVESLGGEVPVEALAARIDDRTQFVLISHVTVGSGFRHDLAAVGAIAAQRGVPLVVDVAQSVGAIPVDLQSAGVAFAAGTSSKWLLGGAGIGFLYVHPDYQGLAPVAPGWFAAANADDWELMAPRFHTSAQRFQGGIPNILGLFAAAAGARMIQEITIEKVSAAIGHLTEYLLDGLTALGVDVWTPREPSKHAGLVFLRGVDDAALYAEARSANIVVGRFLSGIRIDPHFFNTTGELDVVLGLVAKHRLGR